MPGVRTVIASGNRIVYDGDCPLCTSFVQRLRLMRSAGPIELIDARDRPDLARQLQEQGMSLDQGIVLCVGSECVHADAAMTRLALLSTRSDLFNRLVYWIFRGPGGRAACIPFCVSGETCSCAFAAASACRAGSRGSASRVGDSVR